MYVLQQMFVCVCLDVHELCLLHNLQVIISMYMCCWYSRGGKQSVCGVCRHIDIYHIDLIILVNSFVTLTFRLV